MADLETYHYLFLFFIFCNIGWVQESLIESVYHKRWINRGFLKGSYIPIYGFGGLILFLCSIPFRSNGFLVYISGMISCTILEYFVGWLMETFFHKQFWDYSMMKFTYKNRISLLSSMFWGVLSLFMAYVLAGFLEGLLAILPTPVILIYSIVMAVLMTADAIVSISQYVNLREELKKISKERVRQVITDKFISIGGSAMVRREKILRYFARLNLLAGKDNYDDFINPEEIGDETGEEYLVGKDS
ncbi:MAG: putative ABC transporter permease [Bacteroides sp.]|nr:putative ABC transporter permease [Eubacterium sp.]MCM1418553.1 putative ABC transporter permease [Roseburia sp.]MCM1462608.1 putative ABC transporter permease [Bacteroides sp.]